MTKVEITTKSIENALEKLHFSDKYFFKTISEYIWNGFDAKATEIHVNCEFSSDGSIRKLSIADNGTGINFHELENKFQRFYDSEKVENEEEPTRDNSDIHGFRGVGRLTFFTIAEKAMWDTIYSHDNKNYKYSIEIVSDALDNYHCNPEPPIETTLRTGTSVTFSEFIKLDSWKTRASSEAAMYDYLKKEFCWFIELNKFKNFKLLINGNPIEYNDILDEEREFSVCYSKTTIFNVRFVRWKFQPNNEHSKIYYLDHTGKEIFKENTSLNKKGDKFYNSIFITSKYFENFVYTADPRQSTLVGHSRADPEFKLLYSEVQKFLRLVRKPFLRRQAEEFVAELEEEIIDKKDKSPFELLQVEELESVVKEIFVTEPRIFLSLKREQKQAIIGLLNTLLKSDERDKIIEIIDQIVNLQPKERAELTEILNHTTMSKIIKTMNLVKDRLQVLEILSQLVFNEDLSANEVVHIQSVVENHYWVFGEQYSLVSASEDNFEKALRNHINILTAEDEVVDIDHSDKYKQMDIFICRQEKYSDTVKNIIVELKHPKIRLGEDQLSQVKKYMRTIKAIDRFNANNYLWEFILVGNKYNTSGFIEGELASNKLHAERGLVHSHENTKIYVKTWSEVLNECDIRFKFLNEKLEIDKSNLVQKLNSADEAVELAFNSAVITT